MLGSPRALPSETEINGFQLLSPGSRCGSLARQLRATVLEKYRQFSASGELNTLLMAAAAALPSVPGSHSV